MIHSRQCIDVLVNCDFAEENYRLIEPVLLKHTAVGIINLVWSKDKQGEHTFDWFLPFFKGYVRQNDLGIEIDFNDQFWLAYDTICKWVEPFDIRCMVQIQEMSLNIKKLNEALIRTKPNVNYLKKIYDSIEFKEDRQFNVVPEIKKYKVEL